MTAAILIIFSIYILTREIYDSLKRHWDTQRTNHLGGRIDELRNKFSETESNLENQTTELKSRIFGTDQYLINQPLVEVVYDNRKELFSHIERINRTIRKSQEYDLKQDRKFDERLTHIESYLATPRSKRAPLLGEINVSEFMGIDPGPISKPITVKNNEKLSDKFEPELKDLSVKMKGLEK